MYLTKRQKEVLDFIRAFLEEHGYAPTLQEIGRHLQLSSPATVYKHVQQLARKGYLRKVPHQGRGLVPVDREAAGSVEVPLLGQVIGARSVEALSRPETVGLPLELVGQRPTYALRVRGSSLVDEQIRDGDYLVVEDRTDPEEGETVIATLEGRGVVVRRFFREEGWVRLEPSDAARKPILVRDGEMRIHGVLLGLVRRYP